MFGPIRYRKGYKYQLAGDVSGQTPIKPEKAIDTEFIKLSIDGFMFTRKSYAWDGASGPTWDSLNTMTPSLIHDCFCQLIREGYLPESARKEADLFFYLMLRERKMWFARARVWYAGVRLGARYNTQAPKKEYKAP